MSEPKFKAVHGKNYKQYGLSDERFKELKDAKAIIVGEFIDGLPVVFHTTDQDANLADFLANATRKYKDMLASSERLNTKTSGGGK